MRTCRLASYVCLILIVAALVTVSDFLLIIFWVIRRELLINGDLTSGDTTVGLEFESTLVIGKAHV